jgi:hypothetical protein
VCGLIPSRHWRSKRVYPDPVSLHADGSNLPQHGAPEEAQGLLGGVATVGLLFHRHGRDAPYGGDLGCWIRAVYEVVVEGVDRGFALARPKQCFVGVGPRKLAQRLAWRSVRRSRPMAR